MKLAYPILGHEQPEHIVRLIETLRAPDAIFVIHIDKRSNSWVFAYLQEYASSWSDVHLVAHRHRCHWAQFGIVMATIECMRSLFFLKLPFDYAFLLSGSDYPIKRHEEIVAFLHQNKGQEFIESFPMAEPNRWTLMPGQFQAMGRVMYFHLQFRSKYLIRWKRLFYRGWVPHGGSQWWCLSRAAAMWILEYLHEHPSFTRFFKYVFIPDESMFQTLLSNSPFKKMIQSDDLRYIDWERPNPRSPRTLDDEDFHRLATSAKLFARKFDLESSRGVLGRIDREILRRHSTARCKPPLI